MEKTNTVFILVIVVAVNLSNGFSIKAPVPETVSTSFSGSSSSSSAFAHSSSSSYKFNGPIDPNDLERLKATAAASAGAFAGSGAGSFATAGAIAGAGAQAGGVSGALAGSGSIAGGSGEHSGAANGANAGSDSTNGVILGYGTGSGCTGGSSSCGGNQDSNQIGELAPVDTGAYKIINTNQYATDYPSGSQGTNYAIAGQYVQGSQAAGGGCLTCKGPFPGPNGSIHDYKLASSVPSKGVGLGEASTSQSAYPSGGSAHAGVGAGSAGTYQPPKYDSSLPGAPGSIYASKPAIDILPPAPSETPYHEINNYGIGSGHISPSLIATFPGHSGSIYDSKPVGAVTGAGAGAGAGTYYGGSGPSGNIYGSKPVSGTGAGVGAGAGTGAGVVTGGAGAVAGAGAGAATGGGAGAGAGASAGAAAHAGSGAVSNIPSSHPIVGPACSYTSGSPNKNCGGIASTPASGNSGIGVIPILPGPSGSIYDSKPATSVPVHGAASGAGAGAAAGSYSDSGSAINIPSVGSACSYNPGSPNYCGGTVSTTEHKPAPGNSALISSSLPGPSGSIYSSKPVTSVPSRADTGSGVYSGSGAGAGAGTNSYESGSVSNIPSTPVVGSGCSYAPGALNKCDNGNLPQSGSISGPSAFPSANAAAQSGAGAGAGTGTGSYESGSVSNIPSKPVVESACSYAPGAPNKCDNGNIPQSGGISGPSAFPSSNAASQSGCPNCKGPFPGPIGSIHDYKLASSYASSGAAAFHSGFGAHVAILSPSFGSHVQAPSVHPEVPASQGTYYINKPAPPSSDIEAPLLHSDHSFSGQIPCSDSTCGSEISNHGSGSASGVFTGVYGGGSKGSQNSEVVFVDKDKSGIYGSINHDDAQKSGGIVYDNGDGSYYNVPTTSKPTYKNADQGGYAVSSDAADNTGILIGPGTGHLPIETDAKPFGTQGAFGGSAAFTKGAAHTNNKPFGTQGAFGGSAAFAQGSSNAQSSGNQFIDTLPCAFGDCSSSNTRKETGFATGDVIIQKVDGTLITPVDEGSYKPGCSSGACSSGSGFGSGATSGNSYNNGQVSINQEQGSPVKLECNGASCGDTEVYIIEEKPSNSGSHGSGFGLGCLSGSCKGTGLGSSSGSGSGFATGQVLLQKGDGATYDVTNQGSSGNAVGGSYSGSNVGAYSGNQFGSSGCSTGQCGGSGLDGSFGLASSGGILNKLFGSGGLSGTINKFGGNGLGGGAAYSNSGSYSSASAGSFASASASAHAGSFAHSF